VRSAPVGENEAGELPVLLQHVGEQVLVFAGEVAVDAVVGAHHRGGMALRHADFEGQQVASRAARLPMVMLTELRPLSWSLNA
jgi:hypothetical protein